MGPSYFLAECHKSQLNQASFVLLCFALFSSSGLCLVSVFSADRTNGRAIGTVLRLSSLCRL